MKRAIMIGAVLGVGVGAAAAYAARPDDGTYAGGLVVKGKVTPLDGGAADRVDQSVGGGSVTVGGGAISINGAFSPMRAAMNAKGRLTATSDAGETSESAYTALGLAGYFASTVSDVKISGKARRTSEFEIRVTYKVKCRAFIAEKGGSPPNVKAKLKYVFEGSIEV